MANQGGSQDREAKKPREERFSAGAPKDPDAVAVTGDLRTVLLHVRDFLKGEVDESKNALMTMGRDASFLVQKVAEGSGNQELKDLARRLAATPAQVDTNLYALRETSVWTHIERAQEEAPLAAAADLAVRGGAVGLFDPARLLEVLAKSGRPRRDPNRIQAGDVAWVGVPEQGRVSIRLSTRPPPEHQPTRRLRLRVSSGVVFVGPPAASDGLRLGTVRIDPFATSLDAHVTNGGFVRVKPGTYALHCFWGQAKGLLVHLVSDPDPTEVVETDSSRLAEIPVLVDPTGPI